MAAAETLTAGEIVARKSADVDKASSDEHVKVFVVFSPGTKPSEQNGYSHEANKAATRSYMISQGLRPTGDVRLVSIKEHATGKGDVWDVTYAVGAVPAEDYEGEPVKVIEGDDNVAHAIKPVD
jgi:hypothetical protein